jgi:hypothetical protein
MKKISLIFAVSLLLLPGVTLNARKPFNEKAFISQRTSPDFQNINRAHGSDSVHLYRKESDDLLNQKPVFLLLHFSPGLATMNVTGNQQGTSVSTKSGLSYTGGVGAEAALLKRKTGMLSIGISIDYASFKSISSIDNINGINPDSLADIDNDNYLLHYDINALRETDNLSYLQFPLYLKYSLLLSEAISLYGKVGASLGVNISKKYTTTGNGDFKGEYGKYNGIILYGNELEAYGFGNYDLAVKGTNNFVNPLNISAFAGIGINFSISKVTDLFLGADFNYGVSNIAKPGGTDYSITKGRNTINSIYGMSKANINMLNLQIGINLKIFQY